MTSAVWTRRRRACDRVLNIAFLCALISPTIDNALRPFAASAVEAEQRWAAPFPKLEPSLASWYAFPARFEAWFGDAFGLRDKLVHWHNFRDVFVFGVSPTSQAIMGKDHWLFLTEEHSIPVYRGADPLSFGELEAWRRSLESRRDFCARHQCEYLYVIVPNKSEIYPEYVPANFDRVGPTRLDQLAAHLRARSRVEFLDLRPAMLAEKRNDRPGDYVFAPLGSHWTERGAFAGYRAIVERLQTCHPELQPLARERLRWCHGDDEGETWAQRLYLADQLHQENWIVGEIANKQALVTENGIGVWSSWSSSHPDQTLPRVLVFHDSFGELLRKFFGESFAHTRMIWRNAFTPELVEEERPDIVVQLFVERRLTGLAPVLEMTGREQELEDAFMASSDVRLALDGTREPVELRAIGGTRFSRVPDGLEIRSPDVTDMFDLPPFEFPQGKTLILRLDITSPRDLSLDVAFTTTCEHSYTRSNSYQLTPPVGRSVVYFEMMEPDLRGRLRLRPRTNGAPIVLHALEFRAVDPR